MRGPLAMLEVSVSSLSGEVASLKLKPGAVIADIKKALQKRWGIEPRQRLVHNSEELDKMQTKVAILANGGMCQLTMVRRRPEVADVLGELSSASRDKVTAVLERVRLDLFEDMEILKVVAATGFGLRHVPPAILSSKDVVTELLRHPNMCGAYRFAPEDARQSYEFSIDALKACSASSTIKEVMMYVPSSLWQNADFALEALKLCPDCAVEHIDSCLLQDRAFVLAAVQVHGLIVARVGEELRQDAQIAQAAVRQNRWAMRFLN